MSFEKFDNKVVIVTGSSAGIGQVAAVEFARAGAYVTIHGRSSEGLQHTEQMIQSLTPGESRCRVLCVQGDIQDEATQRELLEKTVAKFGHIDVLVSNVGVLGLEKEDQLSSATLEHLFRVNVFSGVQLLQLAMPYLRKTNGNCIYVSSIASMIQSPLTPFYCMTKAALDSWVRNAAVMYRHDGVRVNSINPGGVNTDFMKRMGMDERMLIQIRNYVRENTPVGNISEPIDQVHAILFVASDRAKYVNGTQFVVDGGQHLVGPKLDLVSP